MDNMRLEAQDVGCVHILHDIVRKCVCVCVCVCRYNNTCNNAHCKLKEGEGYYNMNHQGNWNTLMITLIL